MKKIGNIIWFLITVYVIAPAIYFIVLLLLGSRRLEIAGYENKKKMYELKRKYKKGILVISNHPSFWLEPFIIPAILFGKNIFLHPFREFPWNLPDKKNFSKGWLFFIQGMRFLMVSRNNRREIPDIMKNFGEKICQNEQNGVIHPEGGRTGSGNQNDIIEKNGIRMRKFKDGYLAAIKRGCEKEKGTLPIIIPVLVEGTDKVLPIGQALPNFFKSKIRLTIGSPILADNPTAVEISPEYVQEKIFNLKKPLAC